jgi:hypothetical protein
MGRPSGAVRQGDYKLVESYETGKTELYNLTDDVSESKDLSGRFPGKAKELHALLLNWRKEVKAQYAAPQSKLPKIGPPY